MDSTLTALLESLSQVDHDMKSELHAATPQRWSELCLKRDLIVTGLVAYANRNHAPKSA